MEWTSLNDLREKYLSFFESKGHLRLPSFSLVPNGDKSLLLINSGMAPMKKYFTGEVTPPRSRVTTCQKCIRTPDIEQVGKTARHGTFFEMLGNFSFGDYFKKEATAWAWEFCTKILEMPVDKLYVTIYENDDEAFEIWTKQNGVDPSHIVRLGKEVISGSTARDHADLARRFTSTVEKSTVAALLIADPAASATDIRSFGIMYSVSLIMTATEIIPNLNTKI